MGLRLERDAEHRFVVTDILRLRGTPGEVESFDPGDGTDSTVPAVLVVALPQDPGQAGQAQAAYLTRKLAGFT